MNTQNFVVFKKATGEILWNLTSAPGQVVVGPDCDFLEGFADPRTQYIEDGRIVQRRDYKLDRLPIPCDVWIDGVRYHCTEQPEFEFDVPGEYIVYVDAGPAYLEKEFTYAYQP